MKTTIEYNGRTISFDGSGAEHIVGGEGPIMVKNFDIRPGEVFFDVGAAGGDWTLYALASGAIVYAFEPSVPYFKKLVQDVLSNDPPFDYASVPWQPTQESGFFERAHLFTLGLGREDCVRRLRDQYAEIIAPGDSLCGLPDTQTPVRFLPMDHFLPELTRLDWVKMDIEGAEIEAMLGGKRTIEKFKPNFIIENHVTIDRIGPGMRATRAVERMLEILSGLGHNITEDTHPNTAGR